jgi:hypothetical protein
LLSAAKRRVELSAECQELSESRARVLSV